MNIAVVGGGRRCRRLIEIIERHTFQEIHPKVIIVADMNENAPGIQKANEAGIPVTRDYNEFFDRNDVDLIMELTGNMDTYNDIIQKKHPRVRAISDKTAQLFWEISRVSTLQKKCNQELLETRALYRSVINEMIHDDVLVIAYNYEIIDANATLLNKLGLKREEVIGKRCYEITHRRNIPCSGDNHPCPLEITLKTQAPSQTTHVHLDKDNKEIYCSISTYPLKEKDDIIGAIETSRDITKDINVQKMMMHNEKLASIGRLSAGVAHEINNPLTTILTTAMLIQEDLDPSDPNYEELTTIANETLRCRKIVTNLLDFARQTQPDKRANDVNALLEESINLAVKQAAFKDVVLDGNLTENVPLLSIDRGQFQQAIINLILNAVEATPPGGGVFITSRSNVENKTVEISIRDNGEGIEEELLDKIFDPFFTTKESGTGLGLAIVHGIVEQHSGKVEVNSSPGQGTTFIIQIPYETGESDVR